MPKKDALSAELTKSIAGIPESISAAIQSISKGLGVAATELWTIFVKQYIVRGVSQLFTAIVCFTATAIFWQQIGFYAFIPFAVGMCFTYGAIAYLGNPKYYALADITSRIQEAVDTKKPNDTKKSSSYLSVW